MKLLCTGRRGEGEMMGGRGEEGDDDDDDVQFSEAIVGM